MEVVFERTGERRYAVEIHRGEEVLRMDPAPGFDDYFPHDLQHLIVEEQLGLRQGIFGRLADGGTAATFAPVGRAAVSKREASRKRRKLQRKENQLSDQGSQFDQSERATFLAWHAWLSRCPEPALRKRAAAMAEDAISVGNQMRVDERSRFEARRNELFDRIDDVARQWRAVEIGDRLSIRWRPIPAPTT